MTKIQNSNRGFTLVELLLTLVVLGIAISSIAELYYSTQSAQVQSQHLDLATRAARTEIESLRNNGYNSLTPGDSINFSDKLPASLPSDKTGIVEVSQPSDGLRRVDVSVSYTDGPKPQTVKLSSDIGVIGIGQGL